MESSLIAGLASMGAVVPPLAKTPAIVAADGSGDGFRASLTDAALRVRGDSQAGLNADAQMESVATAFIRQGPTAAAATAPATAPAATATAMAGARMQGAAGIMPPAPKTADAVDDSSTVSERRSSGIEAGVQETGDGEQTRSTEEHPAEGRVQNVGVSQSSSAGATAKPQGVYGMQQPGQTAAEEALQSASSDVQDTPTDRMETLSTKSAKPSVSLDPTAAPAGPVVARPDSEYRESERVVSVPIPPQQNVGAAGSAPVNEIAPIVVKGEAAILPAFDAPVSVVKDVEDRPAAPASIARSGDTLAPIASPEISGGKVGNTPAAISAANMQPTPDAKSSGSEAVPDRSALNAALPAEFAPSSSVLKTNAAPLVAGTSVSKSGRAALNEVDRRPKDILPGGAVATLSMVRASVSSTAAAPDVPVASETSGSVRHAGRLASSSAAAAGDAPSTQAVAPPQSADADGAGQGVLPQTTNLVITQATNSIVPSISAIVAATGAEPALQNAVAGAGAAGKVAQKRDLHTSVLKSAATATSGFVTPSGTDGTQAVVSALHAPLPVSVATPALSPVPDVSLARASVGSGVEAASGKASGNGSTASAALPGMPQNKALESGATVNASQPASVAGMAQSGNLAQAKDSAATKEAFSAVMENHGAAAATTGSAGVPGAAAVSLAAVSSAAVAEPGFGPSGAQALVQGAPGHGAAPAARSATEMTLPAHTTLEATPNVLEVGVASGTNGWLKVRAEMNGEGGVAASVVASSASAVESLHKDLPALAAYLKQESPGVSSLVVTRAESGAMTQDAAMSFSAGAQQGRQQSSGSAGEVEAAENPGDTRSLPGNASLPSAGLGTNTGFGSGSGGWLNVVA